MESDQCNYRRYSTEGGWPPSGTQDFELNGNHIENNARNIVSRHSPSMEESLSLSRYNKSTNVHQQLNNFILIYSVLVLLALVHR